MLLLEQSINPELMEAIYIYIHQESLVHAICTKFVLSDSIKMGPNNSIYKYTCCLLIADIHISGRAQWGNGFTYRDLHMAVK